VGTVAAMRTRGVLQLATVAVAVALTGHLLMHLSSHEHPGAADHHVIAAHPAPSSLSAVPATIPVEGSGAHLMAALCMAVLTVAAIAAAMRLGVGGATSAVVHRSALAHTFPQRRRAPPPLRSRVDAGVLLRV
jgi:hypothetical protein